MPDREPLTSLNEPSPRLRAQFLWLASGMVVYGLCQWGMLTAMTRMAVPPAEIGYFSLAYAVSVPIMLLFNLQLRSIQASDAADEYAFEDFLTVRLLTTPAAWLVIAAVVLAVGYPLAATSIILLVGAIKAADALSDLCHGVFQRHEQMQRMARSLVLRGTLALAVLIGVYGWTGSLPTAVGGMFVTTALVLALYDWPRASRVRRARSPVTGSAASARPGRAHRVTHLARRALPLGVAVLLMASLQQLPQIMTERLLGAAALGRLAPIYFMVIAGSTIVTALGESSLSRLARFRAAGQDAAWWALSRRLIGIAAIGGAALVGVALIGRGHLLHLLYGPGYAGEGPLLVLLCVAGAFGFVTHVQAYQLISIRGYAALLGAYGFIAAVATACYLLLVPRYGLTGVGAALLASHVLTIVLLAVLLRRPTNRVDRYPATRVDPPHHRPSPPNQPAHQPPVHPD